MFFIALLVMVCFYLLTLALILLPIRASRNTLLFLWICHIVALAIIGYYIDPSKELDLYKQYRDIDSLREGTMGIFESPFFVLNIFYWLISRTNYDGWYAFFSILIMGGLEYSIIKQYTSHNQYGSKAVALYFLGCNVNGFIVYLFIGRSFTVATIFVYAFYIWYEKNKKMFWALIIFCCFIHSLGVILLFFTIAYEITKYLRSGNMNILMFKYMIVIGIGIGIGVVLLLNTDILSKILKVIPLDFYSYLQDKYQAYSVRGIEFQQHREMVFRSLNLLYTLVCLLYLWHIGNTKYEIYAFFIVATFIAFNFSIILERMPYVIGIALLPIINEVILNTKKTVSKLFIYTGAVILTVQTIWGIYETYIWMDFAI